MAHVICEPCVGTKDKACAAVCPVDCIQEAAHCEGDPQRGDAMLYIDPSICIDCNSCVEVCPVEAIFHEDEVPEEWQSYIDINAAAFHV